MRGCGSAGVQVRRYFRGTYWIWISAGAVTQRSLSALQVFAMPQTLGKVCRSTCLEFLYSPHPSINADAVAGRNGFVCCKHLELQQAHNVCYLLFQSSASTANTQFRMSLEAYTIQQCRKVNAALGFAKPMNIATTYHQDSFSNAAGNSPFTQEGLRPHEP